MLECWLFFLSYLSQLRLSSQQNLAQRQVEQVKVRMGIQIDDVHFRNLLIETQVRFPFSL